MFGRSLLVSLSLLSSACWGAWDIPAQQPVVAGAAEVERYLEQTYPQAGDLRLRYQSKSKLGDHYHFDVWLDGEYRHQRTLVASVNSDQQIYQVFRKLSETRIVGGTAEVTSEIEPDWQRRLVGAFPPDSSTEVTLDLNLVTPDLRTMNRQTAPDELYTDLNTYISDYNPRYLPFKIPASAKDGKIYLTNARVMQVDIEHLMIPARGDSPEQRDESSQFLDPEGVVAFSDVAEGSKQKLADKAFPQLMAFYHLDGSVRYLEKLGYKLFSGPVRFDARGQDGDNSTYYPDADVIAYGAGGSPDALDADVVLHEFGHTINYHIVPDWAYGHTGAIGEGLGDYWAGSYSYRVQHAKGNAFELDTVFNWDGYFGFKKNTRSLNNQRARYFENADYLAHYFVGGELSDELWSTPIFQALKDGVALYEEAAFDEMDTIVLESLFAVGRGVKMHELAEQMVAVAKALYPEREHAKHLEARFRHHGLLSSPFRLQVDSPFVESGTELTTTLVTGRRPASVTGEFKADDGKATQVDSKPFERLPVKLPMPQGLACGASITVTADLDYQYGDKLARQTLALSQTLFKGKPQLSGHNQQMGSILPDATQGSFDSVNAGFKVFTYLLNGVDGNVNEQFAVALDLTHSRLSDLKVTLISPKGSRVVLFSGHKPLATPFKTVLALSRNPAMKPLLGEPLAGTWRLEVIDLMFGEQGRIDSLALGNITGYQCAESEGQKPGEQTSQDSGSSGGSMSWQTLWLLMFPLAWKRILKPAKKK